jgi:hypothetical protein
MSDASGNLGVANDGVDTEKQFAFCQFSCFLIFFTVAVALLPRRSDVSIAKCMMSSTY